METTNNKIQQFVENIGGRKVLLWLSVWLVMLCIGCFMLITHLTSCIV